VIGNCSRVYRVLAFIALLTAAAAADAHEAHMLIGRSASGQLKWHPAQGVPNEQLTVLAWIPPGGPLQGYSASIPGFSLVLTAAPEHDCYPLASGADIWVELVSIDAPLLMVETPSYRIINEQQPPEMRIGGQANSHVHPLWLLDGSDPAFDPPWCVWRVRFVLKDKGPTGYATSEVLTFLFSAGRIPCPADFDCDGDVDGDDLVLFESRSTGPAIAYDPEAGSTGCALRPDEEGIIPADFDRDGDVDQEDFGVFQRCYTGPGEAADPGCTD
jgi:hypothetical protein